MVAFLKKPQGSKDFHQIVDFLNASHIKYALTKNPTIYVSPINQFWRTASTKTLDNGEIELNATVDGQDKTITEASVRRHLKLADADGVETSLFPTMVVNEQLSPGEGPTSPVGTQHTPTVIETSPQLQNLSITYRKTRNRIRRMGIRISQSNVLSSVADEAITKEMHDRLGRATTTTSSLEAEQGSGGSSVQARPERLSNLPNEPPLGEDKGKAIMQESEPPKKIKKKEMIQIGHDEELAQKLHAEELVKDITRQEQERYDLEKALDCKKQLDERNKVIVNLKLMKLIERSDVLRYHAFRTVFL
ncbi:hypothetical protein Tco_0285444 [Tanacetum coccineum]